MHEQIHIFDLKSDYGQYFLDISFEKKNLEN